MFLMYSVTSFPVYSLFVVVVDKLLGLDSQVYNKTIIENVTCK